MYFVSNTMIIDNVIVRNTADSGGGIGISNADDFYSEPLLVNNTVAGNTANQVIGSGIWLGGFNYFVSLTNNIVTAPAGQQAITCDGTFTNASPVFSHNDVYSGGQTAWSGTCDFNANPGNMFADPLLVNPSVSNFHLQPGSVAINAGNNAASNLPSTDFDGNPRIVNGVVDLGASEYQGPTTAAPSPTSLTFSNQLIATSSVALPVTIANTGALSLQISSISTTGVFSETDNCQTSSGLAAGQVCQINVQFSPLAPGLQQGQLRIAANVAGGLLVLPLSGTGVSSSAGSSAALLGADAATLGNWQANYGLEGFSIANGPQTLPIYDPSLAMQGQANWTWVASTSDPRALHLPAGGALAAAWYNATSLSFDVNFIDGKTHQLALYALDWDSRGRAEKIQVLDAVSNSPLASTDVSNFSNGVYLVWSISGHVKILVTATSGPNAAISGIFFGGASGSVPTPSLSIAKTHAGPVQQGQQALTYSVTVTNAAGAGPTSGTVTVTETVPPGLALVSMAGGGWTCPPSTNACTRGTVLTPGNSYAAIVVTVNVAANAASPQVNQVTVSGGGSPSAGASDSTTITSATVGGPAVRFVGTDAVTQGNWEGKYGSDGYDVINGALPAKIPSYAQFSTNGNPYTWTPATSDPRALENSNSGPAGARIAATWYNYPSFSFDVNFTDGNAHQCALYALDWDFGARIETVTVVDPNNNNAVLDTRTISGFTGGIYFLWNISGHVEIVVTSNAGANAVVSGVFFDPAAPPNNVVYTLTGSINPAFGAVHAEGFQFTAPGYITSEVDLSASQLSSCVACAPAGTAVQFFPNGTVSTVIPVDSISFTDANGIVYGFLFSPGTFSAPGTYTTSDFPPNIISNIGTLTVRVTP